MGCTTCKILSLIASYCLLLNQVVNRLSNLYIMQCLNGLSNCESIRAKTSFNMYNEPKQDVCTKLVVSIINKPDYDGSKQMF